MIIDEIYHDNNNSYHNSKNTLVLEASSKKKLLLTENSNSSHLIKSKGIMVNKKFQSIQTTSPFNKHNNKIYTNDYSTNEKTLSPYSGITKHFALTNNNNHEYLNTHSHIFPYEVQDMKIRLAEDKIVKRPNINDYNKDSLYGKPTNAYTTERLNLFQTVSNENNQSGRTFRKFNQCFQARNTDIYSCEYCSEIYKSMIINHEELKSIRCPRCGNILNDTSYQYYYRIYNTLSPEKQASKGGNLDFGRMSSNWNKWIQVKSEQIKENMAYDYLSGRLAMNQSNNNDVKLKEMISLTREKLNKSSQRYFK